ncbi:MAG: hypothetical protein US62_C0005G0024 [Candidatus Woesebacteria bacterium GW2011_GWA1_37_8]|uniref:Uncharacterized protein n=2 Tax=Candidatus Woeseibacteriota TaxID=1752722 RepID=A0A0G0NLE2_9BACT|nr:MAG: hypothetical protein US39_C0004G0001 [Microgenomates group bacterium GW2011_GWC1_37_12b]KKQ46101.1 MAG: hypothetical protein US62_C0005G0024 [Candidatus Woesebacteria bacterium GW2011_GWA1_37_8]KKQ86709.1 MAG: hypothetical protein UT10_C0018G0021 [Candidatus Woesebacteria bacterium GW2011_GWB1_38_8b]
MINKIKNSLVIFLILVVGILASRDLFRFGYFPMHDDLQMMRQLQLEKCFKDGQIPCRWVPDMAYGYGFPLFNYYPPLPYLIGQVFRTMGLPFTDTAKYTFALSIILSGITMYLFSRRFFGKFGGFISSVFYVWAPYHAVDVYVRGAMNESWALVWFPLIFLSSYEMLKTKKKFLENGWGLVFSVSLFCLLTTHNLMVLIFIPIVMVWLFLRLFIEKAITSKIFEYLFYGLLGLGMASFFTLPALLENKFTQVKSQLQGYYDYSAHFVSIYQLLFSRFWGFGPSVWGIEADRMAFPVGHFHWIASIIVIFLLAAYLIKKRDKLIIIIKENDTLFLTGFLFCVGWVSAFFVHQKSAIIWSAIEQLRYLQFPWRFITITIFSFSFIAGFIPYIILKFFEGRSWLIKFSLKIFSSAILLLLTLLLIVFNWNYFKVETIGPVTDEGKFSGVAWDLQQTAGIYDYLPIQAKIAPNGPKRVIAEIMDGKVEISEPSEGTNWIRFKAKVLSEDSKVRINTLDFPNWRVFANGIELKKYIPEEEMFGRFWIDLPMGDHEIYAKLYNTPVRTISNIISLGSFSLFFIVLYLRRNKPKNI